MHWRKDIITHFRDYLDSGSDLTLFLGDPKCHYGLLVIKGDFGGQVSNGVLWRFIYSGYGGSPNPHSGYFAELECIITTVIHRSWQSGGYYGAKGNMEVI